MTIPHPIPYQGSKRNLASHVLRYFPTDAARLIEPFAGSAAISLAAASQKRVVHFLLNDLNTPLIRLWHMIVHQPDELAAQYDALWQAQVGRERQFYDDVRQLFNQTHRPDYFLYLLARCVKAAVRYNTKGEFNQSPDNRRKGRQPDAMRHDIGGAAHLLKGKTQFSACDYRDVLSEAVQNDIVYLDPPYQGVSANRDARYIGGVDYNDFVDSLNDLNNRHISFIVSYDGRTGEKSFGKSLPTKLNLQQIELKAGRSSQATLLGRQDETYESLYLSSALVARLSPQAEPVQAILWNEMA